MKAPADTVSPRQLLERHLRTAEINITRLHSVNNRNRWTRCDF